MHDILDQALMILVVEAVVFFIGFLSGRSSMRERVETLEAIMFSKSTDREASRGLLLFVLLVVLAIVGAGLLALA